MHGALCHEAAALLGIRYPQQLTVPDGVLILSSRAEAGDEPPAVQIIESRASLGQLKYPDVPALIGISALAGLDAAPSPGQLPSCSIAYLPFRLAAELRAYRSEQPEPVRMLRITTPVGQPRRGWDLEAPVALNTLEAIVFGADLAGALTGADPAQAKWLLRPTGGNPVGLIAHSFGETVVIQELVPAARSSSVGWCAVIDSEHARILLRDEFAPGGMGFRSDGEFAWRFGSYPTQKTGVQAPDTIAGGWETAELLSALVGAERDPPPGNIDRAFALIQYAETLLR
jgi:hypothetical protein